MHLLSLVSDWIGPEVVFPVLVFAIPIIAIVGGIASGIVRSLGHQRMLELAQRERIAAIERGLDPSKLPALPFSTYGDDAFAAHTDRRRHQGLLIGGVVMVFAGVGLLVFLILIEPAKNLWAVSLIPILTGAALLLSAIIVRPRESNGRHGSPPVA